MSVIQPFASTVSACSGIVEFFSAKVWQVFKRYLCLSVLSFTTNKHIQGHSGHYCVLLKKTSLEHLERLEHQIQTAALLLMSYRINTKEK